MRSKSSKREFLRTARAWNKRAHQVQSPLFRQSDFFDPRDKVQVKYEMLRSVFVDGVTVSEAGQQFGYSRESFYTTVELFNNEGVVGLVDAKRGPKQPRKMTDDVQRLLLEELTQNPSISSRELTERVAQEFGVEIHKRTVERFRSTGGKKNSRT